MILFADIFFVDKAKAYPPYRKIIRLSLKVEHRVTGVCIIFWYLIRQCHITSKLKFGLRNNVVFGVQTLVWKKTDSAFSF